MYQALYRKYRPNTFDDVCGQDHITSVLRVQLQKGRVSHAYIFCGSRGTGKTTCAKILAKAVNCLSPINGEPCNECPSCLAIQEERVMDVVEMDAASNNGVDAIRRLCDEVQYLPSEAKKRVYIIDEVHMLSTNAFNALLKTIEEPPAHVLFILATTEVNDIPATIMSRCQRFDFKRITPEIITDRLLSISEKENIALSRDAAQVIARLSDGAMRDALSLLEACQGHDGSIDQEKIHQILGIGSRSTVIRLCRALANKDLDAALHIISQIYEELSDLKEVIGELITLYRDLLILRSVRDPDGYLDCYAGELEELKEIAASFTVENILYQAKLLEEFYVTYDRIATGKKASCEILMIRLCNDRLSSDPDALLSRIAELERLERSAPSISKKEPKAKEKSETPPVEDARPVFDDRPSFSTPTNTTFPVLKLKNKLQEESFIKPWLPYMEYEKRGHTIVVKTTSFVKGMLASVDAASRILAISKLFDEEIESVLMEETKSAPVASGAGLEDL